MTDLQKKVEELYAMISDSSGYLFDLLQERMVYDENGNYKKFSLNQSFFVSSTDSAN